MMLKKIKDILVENFPDSNIELSNNFFEDGIIDSFGMVSLILALEKRFNISIPGQKVEKENFLNIEAIENLINSINNEV
tara:strand:- start:210 stop:446 length:237 start_codon:yes stop_codon:yes gene_type:complete